MPGSDFAGGLGLPDLEKYETTEEKLAAIKSSLYMLLENLQYTLRHLDSTNFNGEAMEKWLAGTIEANEIITKSLISDEIYSDYGEIADLTAARLRTDYDKAQRYLNEDTTDLDYIVISGETIRFVTGSVRYLDAERMMPDEEQLESSSGEPYYWRDTRQTQMTCRKKTSWPVWVYGYNELTKGSLHFATRTYVTDGDDVTVKIPIIELGAGSDPTPGHEAYGKATIIKDIDGLYITYVTGMGTTLSFTLTDEGTDGEGNIIPAKISAAVGNNALSVTSSEVKAVSGNNALSVTSSEVKAVSGSNTLSVTSGGAFYNGEELATQADIDAINNTLDASGVSDHGDVLARMLEDIANGDPGEP